ncbi:Uncharacterised protein [Enterobacter cloacae]|uniref:Uncharacterized protein n=1 Tax=Enterobacter cloacae TaxID=550 RepID=A0A377M7Q1_ENTCL|nr:Uncharacterised protein [Enterobacter cloacae]
MSKDGFRADDIASTFARFANKRRNIVCDESKLQRKKPEPLEFSSATNACGTAVLAGIADLMIITPERKKQNEEWSESWMQKEKIGKVKIDNGMITDELRVLSNMQFIL